MAKLKPIAFTVGIMLLIGAALCLYFSLRNLSSIRPASAYEDMGVHIFVPEEVYPVQRENHAMRTALDGTPIPILREQYRGEYLFSPEESTRISARR